MPSLCAATIAFDSPVACRMDFQTFVVTPADRPGWRSVTAFIGLSVCGPEGATGALLLPVDGVPEDVRARPVNLLQFDSECLAGGDFDGAFARRSSRERNAATALSAGICLAGGPPAWLVLTARQPMAARPLEAVVSSRGMIDLPPHRLQQARILIGDAGLAEVPSWLRPAVNRSMASSSARCVIAVLLQPGMMSEDRFNMPAISGIKVSFLLPVGRRGEAEALRLVCATCTPPGPALTRIYVHCEPDMATGMSFVGKVAAEPPPQQVVDSVLEGFGYSQKCLNEHQRDSAAILCDAVRCSSGATTVRLIGASQAFADPPFVLTHKRSLGRLGVCRAWGGAAFGVLIWPFISGAYLGLLWLSVHVFRWLAGISPASLSIRNFALLAVLSPIVTPFFALGVLRTGERPTRDHAGEGALSVLSTSEYQALARLVTWLCFSATYLLLVLLLVRLALWLA